MAKAGVERSAGARLKGKEKAPDGAFGLCLFSAVVGERLCCLSGTYAAAKSDSLIHDYGCIILILR